MLNTQHIQFKLYHNSSLFIDSEIHPEVHSIEAVSNGGSRVDCTDAATCSVDGRKFESLQ